MVNLLRIPFRRLAQQLFVQALAALTPFIALPIVSRVSSAEEWGAFVLGQSLGILIGTVSNYGWGLIGVTRIAQARMNTVRSIYLFSVWSRVVPLLAALMIAVPVLTVSGLTDAQFVTVPIMVGYASYACLYSGWLFVGIGKPWKSAVYQVAPLFVATVVSAVAINAGAPPPILGGAVFVATLFGVYSVSRFEFPRVASGISSVRERVTSAYAKKLVTFYAENWGIALQQVMAAVYVAVPMILATALLDSAGSAEYASADRTMLLASTSVVAMSSVLQAWSGAIDSPKVKWICLAFNVAIGAGVCVILIAFGKQLIGLLTGSHFSGQLSISVVLGLFVLVYSVRSGLLRYFLVPRMMGKDSAFGVFIGLSMLLTGTLVGRQPESPTDLLVCLLVAETLMTTWYLVAVARSHAGWKLGGRSTRVQRTRFASRSS